MSVFSDICLTCLIFKMENIELNIELSNLHEEILYFLLKYRDFSKYTEKPNFLFRPTTDIEALNQGRWFYDNPTGWVNIYFTKSNEQRHYQNNVQFDINTNGGWNIGVYVLTYVSHLKCQ